MAKQHDQKAEPSLGERVAILEGEVQALKAMLPRPGALAVRSIPGALGRPECPRGHLQQVTDAYCQACFREDRNPKPPTGNDAA